MRMALTSLTSATFLVWKASAAIPKVNASRNASRPSVAPTIAPTGASFSSSCTFCLSLARR